METVALASLGSVLIGGLVIDNIPNKKIKTCIDAYTFTGENNHDFVQCMKGQFPEKFTDAYLCKLKSDAKLAEVNQ